MKVLIAITVAIVLLGIAPTSAKPLPPNAEIGCKMLNDLMRPYMWRADDTEFLECNREHNDATYLHMQSVGKCMQYFVMSWTSEERRPNSIRSLPAKVYATIQQGCAMLVLNISQDEFDARCTSFCPRARPQ